MGTLIERTWYFSHACGIPGMRDALAREAEAEVFKLLHEAVEAAKGHPAVPASGDRIATQAASAKAVLKMR